MKLSISRCSKCSHIRLVDNIAGKWICFACKHKHRKEVEDARIQEKARSKAAKSLNKMK